MKKRGSKRWSEFFFFEKERSRRCEVREVEKKSKISLSLFSFLAQRTAHAIPILSRSFESAPRSPILSPSQQHETSHPQAQSSSKERKSWTGEASKEEERESTFFSLCLSVSPRSPPSASSLSSSNSNSISSLSLRVFSLPTPPNNQPETSTTSRARLSRKEKRQRRAKSPPAKRCHAFLKIQQSERREKHRFRQCSLASFVHLRER